MFQLGGKSNKRSEISPERRKELSQPGAIYIITCLADNFFCEDHEHGCLRGFFSLYLQAIYGISFAKKHQIPYYIDFGNVKYFYSDETRFNGDRNFWNYYFNQSYELKSFTKPIENDIYENFPLKIWSRHLFREIHKAHASIELKEETKEYFKKHTEPFSDKRVLGVHLRRTDHYLELKPVALSVYLNLIDRNISHYDKLFVATDDQDALLLLADRYPDKIIHNSVSRSSGKNAVHFNWDLKNRYELGIEALLDCYCLSLCSKVILSPSNFSLAALIFNPELKYILVESFEAKWKRLKTLIVFYLDRWNIRKW